MRKQNHLTKRVWFIGLAAAMMIFALGCGKAELKVNYYVDGKKVEELPEQGLYEIKSIRCNKKDANATWDNNSWSLKTDDIGKSVKVDLDFTYTQSTFTMNGIGYDSLQAAFDAAGTDPATVQITKEATGSAVTAVGSDITLKLNGFTLQGTGTDTIVNNGNMTIIGGSGTITNSSAGEGKALVNFGTLSVSDVTFNTEANAFTVWNSNNGQSSMELNGCTISRTSADVVPLVNSGVLTLNSCTITGAGDLTHPTLLQNHKNASVSVNATTITNSGSGYSLYLESGTANIDSSSNVPNPYGLEGAEEAPSEEAPAEENTVTE